MPNYKIAIVYDWIDKWGGVERLLLEMHKILPAADFYTSYYDPRKAPWAKNLKITTSFLQSFPAIIKGSRIASLPFYPFAFESFNFDGYDLVISVTSAFAKSVITKSGTRHLCYLLTPTRFLWQSSDDYFQNKTVKSLLSVYLEKLRNWDFISAQRPDNIISISKTVAGRCQKYYRRESEVIYPPFDIAYWNKIKSEIRNPHFVFQTSRGEPKSETNSKFKIQKNYQKYFLVVSRLEPYKKIDLVIRAFNQGIPIGQRPSKIGDYSGAALIVVGEGGEQNKLKQIAGNNIFFLEKVSDEELAELYLNAEALIMPQEEDFGYVSLEAQFFGCPVISLKAGGTTETVIEGKTGIFFAEQTAGSLLNALTTFNMIKYDLKKTTEKLGQKNTEKFSESRFAENFQALLTLNSMNQKSKRNIKM